MTKSIFFPQNMTTYGLLSLENPLDRSQPPLYFVTKWQKIATKQNPSHDWEFGVRTSFHYAYAMHPKKKRQNKFG